MKEQDLFDWLKAGHYSDLEKSSNEYDGFDCTSNHFKMFIELKSRLTHYDTLLLERKKFDFLVVTAEVLGYQPWYINSTPLGVWAFPLNSVVKDLEWVDKAAKIIEDIVREAEVGAFYTGKVTRIEKFGAFVEL